MNKEEIIKRLKDILKHTTVTEKTVIIPKYILDDILVKEKGGSVSADEIGLPVSSNGEVLPCGATAVWMKA